MVEGAGGDIETEFLRRIASENLVALWVARRGVDLSRPKSPAEAVIWRFDDVRPHIMAAGDVVSPEDAFRRVLVLENPAFGGEMRASTRFLPICNWCFRARSRRATATARPRCAS